MHGHQWVPAEGTIIDVESRRHEHIYTIDGLNSRNVNVRGTVKHKSATFYPVGSKVRIEIDEHNQMRFDQNAPGGDPLISTMTMSDQIAEAANAFDRPGSYGPDFGGPAGQPGTVILTGGSTVGLGGGLPEGLAGFVSTFGGASAQVIGPDGSQLPINAQEIAQLTQAVLSGDPAARQAAIQRLHAIRASAMDQFTSNHGSDAMTYGSALPAASGTTAEQRLAALDQLLSKGMLSQAEYETQRQRIIESI
jgi:hypothetical protein